MITYKEAVIAVMLVAERVAYSAHNQSLRLQHAVDMVKVMAVLREFSKETPWKELEDLLGVRESAVIASEDVATYAGVPLFVSTSYVQTDQERALRAALFRLVRSTRAAMNEIGRCGYPDVSGAPCVRGLDHQGMHTPGTGVYYETGNDVWGVLGASGAR